MCGIPVQNSPIGFFDWLHYFPLTRFYPKKDLVKACRLMNERPSQEGMQVILEELGLVDF